MASKAKKAKADENSVVKITVEGQTYVLDWSHIKGRIATRFRREAGYSVRALGERLVDDPDIDLIAAVVWLARLQAGENITFDEVSEDIAYDTELDMETENAPSEAEVTDPEV